jgi:hypothetical protein
MNINLSPPIGGQGLCEHEENPQGLKPNHLIGFIGTTEVVPCYKACLNCTVCEFFRNL